MKFLLQRTSSWSDSRFFGLFLLICAFSLLPSFYFPVTHVDEGSLATLGRYAFSGQLYEVFTDLKPPLLFQLYWLFSLGGHSLYAFHIFQCIWLALSAFAFFKLLSFVFDQRTSLITTLLFCFFVGRINYGGGMPERLLMPFIIIGTYLAAKTFFVEGFSRKLLISFAVGALVGAASVVKQPGGLLGIAAFGLLFIQRKGFVFLAVGIAGILSATFLSFWLTGVDFDVIWQEAYAINFKTYMSAPIDTAKKEFEIIKTSFEMYFIEYSALTLLALLALVIGFKNYLRMSIEKRIYIAILVVYLMFNLVAVSLGGRFYSNYHIMSLFGLGLLAALAVEKLRHRKDFVLFFLLALGSNLLYHGISFYGTKGGSSKNWDHPIQKLHQEVKTRSLQHESIWVSHGVPSIYFTAQREPAVKFIHFMHNINYVDVCLIAEDRISELRLNHHYRQTVAELRSRKPKLIFWTQRAKNSCTDRLKLQYFPEILEIIQQSYRLQYQDELGSLYELKDSAS